MRMVLALVAMGLMLVSARAEPVERVSLTAMTARMEFDKATSQPTVVVALNRASRKVLAEFTEANVGRQVALRVAGRTISSPTIQAPMTTGWFTLSGGMTLAEADALAKELKHGEGLIEVELVPRAVP
ncbi:SecDF P1 head subdomain-containing protein [Xanthobacteraceae bacterium A53D]